MIATWWFVVIAVCLLAYAVLGGYSVGLGISILAERRPASRREIVEIIGTAWEGNETWLILLVTALWAGFPAAAGVILPHVFLPLLVMLLAIGVRGVSIELVTAQPRRREPGVWIIGVASVVIAAAQGMTLGALTQDVATSRGAYAGGALQFFDVFSILCALVVPLTYAILGAAFLAFKTTGAVRSAAVRRGRVLVVLDAIVVTIAALSLNATASPYAVRSAPVLVLALVLLAVVIAATAVVWVTFPSTPPTERGSTVTFRAAVAAVLAGLVAVVVLRFPLLLPPSLTVGSAASPRGTLNFLLVGIGLNIPVVLFYNWYSYHVFRGRWSDRVRRRPEGRSATAAALGARS